MMSITSTKQPCHPMLQIWTLRQSRDSTQDGPQILYHQLRCLLVLPTLHSSYNHCSLRWFLLPSFTLATWILHERWHNYTSSFLVYRRLPKEITESQNGRALGSEMGKQKGTQGQHLGWDCTDDWRQENWAHRRGAAFGPAPGSVFLSTVFGTIGEEEIFLYPSRFFWLVY